MILIADISFSTEGAVVIGALLTALSTAVVFMFRQVLAAKDERLNEMKSYKEIAAEAIIALEAKVNEERQAAGKKDFKKLAPVVAEHSSPVTPEQQNTAELQTMRARITAATLALGLPPREAGLPEKPLATDSIMGDLKRVIAVDLKKEIDKVPEKTAAKVVEKLDEQKAEDDAR